MAGPEGASPTGARPVRVAELGRPLVETRVSVRSTEDRGGPAALARQVSLARAPGGRPAELKAVNAALCQVEVKIRACERTGTSGRASSHWRAQSMARKPPRRLEAADQPRVGVFADRGEEPRRELTATVIGRGRAPPGSPSRFRWRVRLARQGSGRRQVRSRARRLSA